jgi:hypothetical protein
MEQTMEQYLDWYDKGLISIFPFILVNKSVIVMIIQIPQN